MPVLGQREQTTFRHRPCHDPKTGVKSPRVSQLSVARSAPLARPPRRQLEWVIRTARTRWMSVSEPVAPVKPA